MRASVGLGDPLPSRSFAMLLADLSALLAVAQRPQLFAPSTTTIARSPHFMAAGFA